MSAAKTPRKWTKGDRCRFDRFGEWRNGTIAAIAYGGEVALVTRDGERVERAVLVSRLREPVES